MAFFSLSSSLSLSLQLIANSPRRSYRRVLKFCMGSKVTKILGFQPPALCDFWAEKGGILKSYRWVPKLKI
jgi:hypothetical protein